MIATQSGSLTAAEMARAIEARVRASTHGRVGALLVEPTPGRFRLSGLCGTQHARQLALESALDLLPPEALDARDLLVATRG